MADETIYLKFDDLSQPVRMRDCEPLLELVELLFPGWPVERAANHSTTPVLSVARGGDVYRFDGFWLREPLLRRDLLSAASALVAEVVRAWVRDGDRLLCLHGAAVCFAGQLVVFPSQYRAGKSLLGACLAAAGIPLYADDVLPIRIADGRAMAPGLAPRLRLPLPDGLDSATRDWIDRHRARDDGRYLYLDLAESELAARGSLAPIGSFVLLERSPGAAPVLEPIAAAEVLRQVVWQNFSREAEAPRILEVLNALVGRAQRYRLRYDEPGAAVALLAHRFGRWPQRGDDGELSTFASAPAGESTPLLPGRYRRREDIRMLELDGVCFLADADDAAIHHLNAIGTAIWNLLAQPASLDEMIDLLGAAFPEIERARIEHDLDELIATLRRKGLVESADDAGASADGIRAG